MSAQDALRLAAVGFSVFPLRRGAKLPATEHGCLDASRDPVMVSAMFTAVSDANIGIACGPSDLVVVDLDSEDAVAVWRGLQAKHGKAPALTSRTPRGWHCYYRAPRDHELRNTCGRIAPGIDTRAAGGYVVSPPSRIDAHDGKPGGLYKWSRNGFTRPGPLPMWLLPLMLPPAKISSVPGNTSELGEVGDRYVEAAIRGEVARVTSAVVGTRNHALRAASFALGRLVGAGVLTHGVAEQQLRQAGEAIGLGVVEVGRTVSRGLRDGAREPRQIQRRAVAV
jgi:hypothetical protein